MEPSQLGHGPRIDWFSAQEHPLVGGIPTPLKNISHLGLLFPIFPNIWKIKHVPNHQPVHVGLPPLMEIHIYICNQLMFLTGRNPRCANAPPCIERRRKSCKLVMAFSQGESHACHGHDIHGIWGAAKFCIFSMFEIGLETSLMDWFPHVSTMAHAEPQRYP